MRKLLTFKMLTVLFASSLFFATTAFSVKPGEEVNPNGFPSGEHYNLILNAKKSDYNCTPVVYDEGAEVYGKVIFIPQYTQDFDGKVGILMESGKNGPKSAPDAATLEVIDQCAGFDGNPAILRLPKSEYGYDVYLRAKGKPTDEEMEIFGKLQYVEDENHTPLIFLGTWPDAQRKKSLTRPKGKIRAEDISYLFMWTGALCYAADPITGLFPDNFNTNLYTPRCCTIIDTDGDLSYDCPTDVSDQCAEGTTLLYCNDILTPMWIFNIEAFVDYLWEVDNNGLRSAQVRFYPRTEPYGQ
jgi:hypothetical protein